MTCSEKPVLLYIFLLWYDEEGGWTALIGLSAAASLPLLPVWPRLWYKLSSVHVCIAFCSCSKFVLYSKRAFCYRI